MSDPPPPSRTTSYTLYQCRATLNLLWLPQPVNPGEAALPILGWLLLALPALALARHYDTTLLGMADDATKAVGGGAVRIGPPCTLLCGLSMLGIGAMDPIDPKLLVGGAVALAFAYSVGWRGLWADELSVLTSTTLYATVLGAAALATSHWLLLPVRTLVLFGAALWGECTSVEEVRGVCFTDHGSGVRYLVRGRFGRVGLTLTRWMDSAEFRGGELDAALPTFDANLPWRGGGAIGQVNWHPPVGRR